LSFKNFGIKFRIICLDGLLFVILCALRAAIVGFVIFKAYPVMWEFIKMTWTLNKVNTWQYPDEPFFTNCNVFNAFLTWCIWIPASFAIYFYGIIIPSVILLLCAASLIKDPAGA
jgi:hypothetical protein